MAYNKMEEYYLETTSKLSSLYKQLLSQLGEDPNREGLLETPERGAKAMQFLTHGYEIDPVAILNSAKVKE